MGVAQGRAMKRPRRPAARPGPDILHLAQDNLGTADQVTVFGGLFDAAIRATHTLLPEDPRRKAVLGEAMDKLYQEINRETPAQVGQGPGKRVPDRAGRLREPRDDVEALVSVR